ncbi:hypothetical protein VAPA_2c11950 [Variovorax paradoxus B4]|uniref:DUF2846 domain-containing protein n=1 Tax=Variovorax paradoxus B4 TaxID=1246301 RepID=T1XN87_VARPD|nr:hypothetical protein VAPA_2c11950 [Variovorax paradoxus B4]
MDLRLACTAIAALLLTACGATGPQFTSAEAPTGESSAIYIYRPSKFAAGGFSPLLVIDDKVIGKISSGSYARRNLDAGVHKIELRRPSEAYGKFKTRSLEVTTKPGSTTYIRYHVEHKGPGEDIGSVAMTAGGLPVPMFMPVIDHMLVAVDPHDGLTEIKETRSIE